MIIIHYNPHDGIITNDYIDTLNRAMGEGVTCLTATSITRLKEILSKQHIDIIDIHGCWHDSLPLVMTLAKKHGTRIVLTPHGQLEPWIIKRQLTSMLLRKHLYQKQLTRRAYAVIVMGKMEHENMKRLGWNRRLETIPCSLFTSSVTDGKMASDTLAIFRKVMDSDVRGLMDATTVKALQLRFKAGITKNKRWINEEEEQLLLSLTKQQWRQIQLYAYYTSTLNVIKSGANTMSLTIPDCHPESIRCYLPSRIETNEVKSIPAIVADADGKHGSEEVLNMIKSLRHKILHNQLGIADIVQISETIFHLKTDEDEVRYLLKDEKLTSFTSRVMSLVKEFTGLPEGFLLLPAINDRKTVQLRQRIIKQLKI